MRGETVRPSFRRSSSARRSSPQVGFARAMATISRCRSTGMVGRPGRDFPRQNSRQPWRCHRISVSGLTTVRSARQSRNRERMSSAARVDALARRGLVAPLLIQRQLLAQEQILGRQLHPGCQDQPDHHDELKEQLMCRAERGGSTARHGTRIVAARDERRWNSCRAHGPDLILRNTKVRNARKRCCH